MYTVFSDIPKICEAIAPGRIHIIIFSSLEQLSILAISPNFAASFSKKNKKIKKIKNFAKFFFKFFAAKG